MSSSSLLTSWCRHRRWILNDRVVLRTPQRLATGPRFVHPCFGVMMCTLIFKARNLKRGLYLGLRYFLAICPPTEYRRIALRESGREKYMIHPGGKCLPSGVDN